MGAEPPATVRLYCTPAVDRRPRAAPPRPSFLADLALRPDPRSSFSLAPRSSFRAGGEHSPQVASAAATPFVPPCAATVYCPLHWNWIRAALPALIVLCLLLRAKPSALLPAFVFRRRPATQHPHPHPPLFSFAPRSRPRPRPSPFAPSPRRRPSLQPTAPRSRPTLLHAIASAPRPSPTLAPLLASSLLVPSHTPPPARLQSAAPFALSLVPSSIAIPPSSSLAARFSPLSFARVSGRPLDPSVFLSDSLCWHPPHWICARALRIGPRPYLLPATLIPARVPRLSARAATPKACHRSPRFVYAPRVASFTPRLTTRTYAHGL